MSDAYLSPSNPRLLQLVVDYQRLNCELSFWRDHRKKVDLQNFRRNLDYLAQVAYSLRDDLLSDIENEKRYWATFGYVAGLKDAQWYLDQLSDDTDFGMTGFTIADKWVTRDLLDSILEIDFLRHYLPIREDDVLLDIGAGYGRFAHRFTTLFPRSHVYCIDAVPESTFVCEYYMRHRGCLDKVEVIPFGQLQVINRRIDIAVNIHSWSECTLNSINFWLDRLADLDVQYLFVVPHSPECLTMELDGTRKSFLPAIKSHGYELLCAVPKFQKQMQSIGIFAATYFLFER
jgi:putative sugar O-methyltransferase